MKKILLTILISSLSTISWAEEKKHTEVDFKKPILYCGSLMLAGYGALVATGEVDKPSLANFKNAFKEGPKSDNSPDFYNFILHPLWGSETYLRAREGNFGVLGSVGFSLCASITWEYFIESWSEHPSSQDLILTTGIGWMIGEARYKLKQKTGSKTHWFIDPINTTLEHLNIGVTTDTKRQKVTIIASRWNF